MDRRDGPAILDTGGLEEGGVTTDKGRGRDQADPGGVLGFGGSADGANIDAVGESHATEVESLKVLEALLALQDEPCRGLALKPASVGSSSERGDTCTFELSGLE